MTPATGTRFVVRGHRDGSYDIAVTGPLDGEATRSLRFLLQDLERHRVMLDLGASTCVTDEALTALVAASRVAEARGGSVALRPTARRHLPTAHAALPATARRPRVVAALGERSRPATAPADARVACGAES